MKEAWLTTLRNKDSPREEFRSAAKRLSFLIAQEAAAKVPLKDKAIATPLEKAKGKEPACQIVLVPVLRAGLALVPAFLDLFPGAKIGVLGIRRDEKTAFPELYYEKLPKISPNDLVFLLDPMVATGGTAILAIDHLLSAGATPTNIRLYGLIGAKPGLEALRKAHPQVPLTLATVDPILDKNHLIVPGLGDFGDRFFL